MTRTNVVLDDFLVGKIKKMTGMRTTREVVNYALRELARHQRQKDILRLRGKVRWEGDLSKMRQGRSFDFS